MEDEYENDDEEMQIFHRSGFNVSLPCTFNTKTFFFLLIFLLVSFYLFVILRTWYMEKNAFLFIKTNKSSAFL